MDAAFLAKYDRRVPRYTSYPTAPHFHAGIDAVTYRRWLETVPADTPLSLYLHIPFCDSLCWFCGCHTKIVRRYGPIERYIEALRREIDMVADMLGGRGTVGCVHWGGGTPTMLSPDDIEGLADHVRRRFNVSAHADFAVEIDPRTFTAERASALARAGVNRVSLGVQDVNPEVQHAINRIQPVEVTRASVDWLREAGIDSINIDLMYGLPQQTISRLLDTVTTVLNLMPNRLTLFGYAHVPWMKRHQRLIDEGALPGPEERLVQQVIVTRLLEDYGFTTIGLDHFARPHDDLARAARAGRLHRNFQGYTTDASSVLLGLGASGIGGLPQGYVQNTTPIRSYLAALSQGALGVVRGIALDDDDRLRRAIIERLMCDLEVDLAALCRRHGRAPDDFAAEREALDAMAGDGIVEMEGWRVRVPTSARPLLRSVCAVFDRYLESGARRHARAV